jgi:tetratricopeptide (TPR) repeat protein
LTSFPEDRDALSSLGTLAFAQGRLDEALDYFNRSVRQDLGGLALEEDLCSRAKVWAKLGRTGSAIADLRSALSLAEGHPERQATIRAQLRSLEGPPQ